MLVLLMTLLNTTNTAGTLLYYTSAYALAGIAAFSVIIYVRQ
jgi:NADH-quinone oxidoreductase subunit N